MCQMLFDLVASKIQENLRDHDYYNLQESSVMSITSILKALW